jgi:hypothetical protein
MKFLKRWLQRWLNESTESGDLLFVGRKPNHVGFNEEQVMNLIPARNGYIIQVYRNGSWQHYVVPEGEDLTGSITTVLVTLRMTK